MHVMNITNGYDILKTIYYFIIHVKQNFAKSLVSDNTDRGLFYVIAL